MQFTQPVFFLFFLCFFLGWRFLSMRSTLRLVYLVLASLLFYSFADWRQVLILLAVGFSSYFGGIALERQSRFRVLTLITALTACLGLLLITKYSVFVLTNISDGLALLSVKASFNPLSLAIKTNFLSTLGVSFYTLQAVGYLLDRYHGRIKTAHNILHYFAFLALFPKLIAGPIERAKDLLPQLIEDRSLPNESQRWEGTRLIVYGYFMKVVIADNLAPFVDSAFNALAVRQNSIYWWVVITAFAFQLYCDFAGYSAIAVGLGKWMGYDLTMNFRHPYLSTSLAEFWTRWHISLSNWLRDFVFFPLNRSRVGRGHPYLNLWITFLVSGVWHGAAWTFILWGGLHAIYNSLERLTQWPNWLKRTRWGHWVALFLVLIQVWTGWVLFRASSVAQSWEILKTLYGFKGGLLTDINPQLFYFLGIAILFEGCSVVQLNQKISIPEGLKNGLEVVFTGLLVVTCVLFRGSGSQFIYFQF
jgi:alginate O-acetyltransferase complex protein AlgI